MSADERGCARMCADEFGRPAGSTQAPPCKSVSARAQTAVLAHHRRSAASRVATKNSDAAVEHHSTAAGMHSAPTNPRSSIGIEMAAKPARHDEHRAWSRRESGDAHSGSGRRPQERVAAAGAGGGGGEAAAKGQTAATAGAAPTNNGQEAVADDGGSPVDVDALVRHEIEDRP